MELCWQQQKEHLHLDFITVVSMAGWLLTVQEFLFLTKVNNVLVYRSRCNKNRGESNF